jgi:hypothetical protein
MGLFARMRLPVQVWTLVAVLGGGLTVAGCGPTQAPGQGVALQASLESLHFEDAFVGQRREGTVLVLNGGETARQVRFASDSPAFEAPEPLELPAQGYREVRVRFAPGDVGRYTARLRVEADDGESVEVALAGQAHPAPACRAPGPCRTARMDLELGRCVYGDVPDGTRCGGACGGTCEAGACVTDSGALAPAWTYVQAEDKDLRFPGLVDAAGSVYWFEYARGTAGEACELVSASRTGEPRYRVALGAANCASTQSGTLLIAGDQLVLGVLGQPEWRKREDGSLVWRPELAPALAGALGVQPTALLGSTVQALAAGRAGQVYGLVNTATQQERASLLVRFEPSSQTLRVLRRFEPTFTPTHLVLDELDWLYVGDAALREVRALSAEGWQRWRSAYGGVPRAAWSARVWTDGGEVLDAQTGQRLYTRAPGDRDSPSPVGGDTLAFAWSPSGACYETGCTVPADRRVALAAIDVRTGLTQWTRPAAQPSAPLYTSRGSVLVPTMEQGAAGLRGGLVELATDGRELQRPELCEQEVLQDSWALHAGRVFGTTVRPTGEGRLGAREVRAYDLPQRVEAASRGWAAERGTLGLTSAAR